MAQRQFVFVFFRDAGAMISAESIKTGKRLVRERFPLAHFSRWQDAPLGARNLPAWHDKGDELRYELGERRDEIRPVAYIRVQPS